MRKRPRHSLWLLLLMGTGALAWAATPEAPPQADPRVLRLLEQVSPDRMERDVRNLVGFGTRSTLSGDAPNRGIGASQRWVQQELERIAATSGGRLRVEADPFTVPAGGRFHLPRSTVVTNTLATLPGTDPSRILVVSGHLDSRASDVFDGISDAPGADDDASGVAAVLEAARAMAPLSFRATVIFIVVSGEEQGLIGSRHWAAAARQRNLPIQAMLDNDIIGSSQGPDGLHDDRRIRLFSTGGNAIEAADADRINFRDGENDSPSRQLARTVAAVQRRYLAGFTVTLVNRHDRLFRGGDHLAFNEQGYAAVRFTEKSEDLRHQHQDVRVQNGVQFGDLLQFLDFAYAARVTRLNLAVLADLAWAPPPPQNVRLVHGPAGLPATDTTLRWDRPADPDRLGFELLWRETTAPDWQSELFVGEGEEATLPLPRDDYLFALRTVSRAGNRSLPVVASS